MLEKIKNLKPRAEFYACDAGQEELSAHVITRGDIIDL